MTLPMPFMPSSAAPVGGNGLGDDRGDLCLGQLLRQVVGQHLRLRVLLLGEFGAAGIGVRLFGLSALLGLPDDDVEHLLIGQLDGLGTGDLGLG